MKLKIISSWDDWCPENIRLANLLLKYKIHGIFFTECNHQTHRGGDGIKQAKELADMGFEIGSHTVSHPIDLKELNDNDLTKEIAYSRGFFQGSTGQEIDWFCYPHGKFDERVKGFVKEAGYKFARSVNLGVPWTDDPYAVYTDFHCYPHRREYEGKEWLEYGKEIIEAKVESFKEPEVHFWGHSWEIEKFGQWEKFEELLRWIKESVK